MFFALIKDDSGQGLVEYGLILLLVSVVAITGFTVFGNKTNNSLSASSRALP